MYLIDGELAEPVDVDEVIAALSAQLPRVLSHAFSSETVLACADRFCDLIDEGGLPVVLDAPLLLELRDFCRREALEARLRRELGEQPMSLRRFDYCQPHFEAWRPLGLVVHLTPGNAPLLPFFAVLEGLLAGNVNWLRPSAADAGLSTRLLHTFVACDEQEVLRDHVAVLPVFQSVLPRLLDLADGVSVWGGDEALASVRAQLRPGCRWIDWGHRIGFAYLVPSAIDDGALDALADDVCRYDQQACSSPQLVWVDSQDPAVLRGVGEGLVRAMVVRGAAWPRQVPDEREASDVTLWVESARLEQVFGERAGEVWSGDGWRVVWQQQEGFEATPLFRSVLLRPMPRERLVSALRPWRTRLQSCAVATRAQDLAPLSRMLIAAGVSRITPLGAMHDSYPGAPHDGFSALSRLSRRVSVSIAPGTLEGHAALDECPAPPCAPALPIMDKAAFQQTLGARAQLFFRSGGSSGTPKLAGFSYRDYHRQMCAAADGLFAAGLDPAHDRVMNLMFGGHLYGGLLSFFSVLDTLRATQFPMGAPTHDDYGEIARLIVEQGVDTLIGMPSTIHQLFVREAAVLRTYGGVKKILLGGEHLGTAQRRFLQDCGVITLRSALYGSVDAGPLGHCCASSEDGVFHLFNGIQSLEILDRERDSPAPVGEAGRLVFTSLAREGQAVVRYDIGDLGHWVAGACACGRSSPRFRLLGRHGKWLRVGTAFLDPAALAAQARVPVQFVVDYAANGCERLCVYVDGRAPDVEMRLRGDTALAEALEDSLLELLVIACDEQRFVRSATSGKRVLVQDRREAARRVAEALEA